MDKKDSDKREDFREKGGVPCRTRDIGLESFRVCLEENPQKCRFALNFGETYFCRYTLRVNIVGVQKK